MNLLNNRTSGIVFRSLKFNIRDVVKTVLLLSLIFFVFMKEYSECAETISLKNEKITAVVNPSSLEMSVSRDNSGMIKISEPIFSGKNYKETAKNDTSFAFTYPEDGISISLSLKDECLLISITAEKESVFKFPAVKSPDYAKALILPYWEGIYVPVNNTRWIEFLTEQSPMNTTSGLTLPFIGIDLDEYKLTYIMTNAYNNEINFINKENRPSFELTHEFTTLDKAKISGCIINLCKSDSPVEPAKQYRNYLMSQNEFVSMKDKYKTVPKAERLAGAAHVYLFGGGLFTKNDIPANKWNAFAKKLIEESKSEKKNPSRHIKTLLGEKGWNIIEQIAAAEFPYDQIKRDAAGAISDILCRKDFYGDAWSEIPIPDEAGKTLIRSDNISTAELCRMNSLLFHSAYKDFVADTETWGDGVSMKMLNQMKKDGLDKMMICVDGKDAVEKKSYIAAEADKMGYLFGIYDSYHSIHDPKLKGTDASWDTAQFDENLYNTGGIQKKDGSKYTGFQKKGYLLSPIAAQSAFEKRVDENFSKAAYTYYFIDCDAYGEVYDDYSPEHSCTQSHDAELRAERLKWISDKYKAVVGSEGGSAYAVPSIHVVEGIAGPPWGWGDEDLKDKQSEYFLGAYYPPDEPGIFFKQTKLKEKYKYFYYSPEYKLPLYETVFHDSVSTTRHWHNDDLKFPEVTNTIYLQEISYMISPLYVLNYGQYNKRKEQILPHYKVFSPLHSKYGFARMKDFRYLSDDRLIQKTVFEGGLEIITNYSSKEYHNITITIPQMSIMINDNGKIDIYTPGKKS